MKSQNKTDTVLSGLIILMIYLFIQFVSGIQIQVTFYVHYRQILLSPLIFYMQNGDAID